MPSPLFNFLFLAALIVPAAMYIGGVIILMLSLVVKHYRLTHTAPALGRSAGALSSEVAMSQNWITLDGNEACARVAYQLSDVIAIYPITPSSSMAEAADAWSAEKVPNLWGSVPTVVEMQSEGGAAGAVHGALQGGSLATTFTASQGLLLMIPNMYKIAGELTPAVFHVSARAVATHALSIFGDHSDVMAVRATGFAMLSSRSVQEAQDLALIAHAASLEARVPFVHFFDGFRTSHEIAKIEPLDRCRRATHDRRSARRGASRAGADARSAGRSRHGAESRRLLPESRSGQYATTWRRPAIVRHAMERFAALTGRAYRLFEYHGAPDAERVIVMMGSGSEAAEAVVDALGAAREGRRADRQAVPAVQRARLRRGAAVDGARHRRSRSHEGARRDRRAAVSGRRDGHRRSAGRWHRAVHGVPAHHRRALWAGLEGVHPGDGQSRVRRARPPGAEARFHRRHRRRRDRAVARRGRGDSRSSRRTRVRAVFFGLGADGTVGANKNTIKIIGEETDNFAQAYFVYDSKKSGAVTISHLRFGPEPIRAPYLISRASFVGCHQFNFLGRYDVLEPAEPGGVFLLNAPYDADDGVGRAAVRRAGADHRQEAALLRHRRVCGGKSRRHGHAHQHDHADVLLRDFRRAAARRGDCPHQAHDREDLRQARRRGRAAELRGSRRDAGPSPAGGRAGVADCLVSRSAAAVADAPDFVKQVTAVMLANHGDRLPVSAFPIDGTWPVGTAKWEKRNLAVRDSRVGRGAVHPVQQVRAGLSARGDSREGVSARSARRCAGDVQERAVQRPGPLGRLHRAGGAGRLHRVPAVRGGVPGERQGRARSQGARDGAAGAASRRRSAATTTSSCSCPKPIARRSGTT